MSNQPQYNALYRIIEPEVIPTSRELGISQIVFSPIAQGVLTGKYQPGQPPPAGSRATDEAGGGAAFIKNLVENDELLTRVQKLAPLAENEGLTMAQLAVAWVLQNDNIASAITGGSRPEQVRQTPLRRTRSCRRTPWPGSTRRSGDAVQRDGSLVGKASPAKRLT